MSDALTAPTGAGERMRAEMLEQPQRWRELAATQRAAVAAAVTLIRTARPQLLLLAGRGSSDHAATYGQYLAHNLLRIPAMLVTPSTLTAFGSRLSYPRSVMIAVSQSGESPDLIDNVRAARDAGIPVVALSNSTRNALASSADAHVELTAGRERAVAATKTYTAELVALYLLITSVSGRAWRRQERAVATAAQVAQASLSRPPAAVAQAVDVLAEQERLLVVGRGYSMASAKETALKLMETCGVAASGWSAADATHGPLGQVASGTPVIAFTGSPGGRASVESFAHAAAALGGELVAIGRPIPGADGITIPTAEPDDPALIPLTEILPAQQLAWNLAILRRRNPDAPAGLAKVTRTC